MATQQESHDENSISRRSFLRRGLWGLLAVLTLEGAIASIASLWPKAQAGSGITKLYAGKISDYPIGSVTHFPAGFFLSRLDSGFLALSQVCTHLGCIVPWKPDETSADKLAPRGRFNCPCHGSIFDRYGRVIVAPATRPMDLYSITLDGDKLYVDTSRAIQRQRYEESQVTKV